MTEQATTSTTLFRALLALAALLTSVHPATVHAQALTTAQVELSVPAPPQVVRALGRDQLAYELHLTNFGASRLHVQRLVIRGDREGIILADWEGASLQQRLAPVGARSATGRPGNVALSRGELAPGGRLVLFAWLTLPAGTRTPAALSHQLVLAGEGAARDTVTGAAIAVEGGRRDPIDAPVGEGSWIAVRGPSNVSGHRRSIVVLDGRARVPQRFAIDWVRLGPDGRVFHGDSTKNENWHGYAAPVRAVAAGTVAGVRDGAADNVALTSPAGAAVDPLTAPGNYVVVDLGGGRFATYAHLRPGSIRVRPGARITAGQVLGEIGNSGNSLAPHLHFQLSDGAVPLASEGLPFTHRTFELLGRLPSLGGALAGQAWTPSPQQPRRTISAELPLENMIVRFP